jgi:hypothetical protein
MQIMIEISIKIKGKIRREKGDSGSGLEDRRLRGFSRQGPILGHRPEGG